MPKDQIITVPLGGGVTAKVNCSEEKVIDEQKVYDVDDDGKKDTFILIRKAVKTDCTKLGRGDRKICEACGGKFPKRLFELKLSSGKTLNETGAKNLAGHKIRVGGKVVVTDPFSNKKVGTGNVTDLKVVGRHVIDDKDIPEIQATVRIDEWSGGSEAAVPLDINLLTPIENVPLKHPESPAKEPAVKPYRKKIDRL